MGIQSPAIAAAAPIIAWVQPIYFSLTGIWPLVHIPSFMAVTGPKTDLWLVRTVGVLIIAIVAPLALAAWRDRISTELILLAVLSAAGLATIDVVYMVTGVISPIYLLDAAAEVLLIAAWAVVALMRTRNRSRSSDPASAKQLRD